MTDTPPPSLADRPGVWSSEYWLSLATIGAYAILCLFDKTEAAYGLLGIQGTYTLGRSWVKGKSAGGT